MIESAEFIHLLSEHKRQIAIGTLSVIAGSMLLIGYFQSGPDALSYAEAESLFSKWQEAPLDDRLYASMKEALRSVPALERKYEAAIAQKLIIADQIDDALLLANRSLNRVKEDVPYHANFAETSLLIEQGGFQEAFEWAISLKEKMAKAFSEEEIGKSLLYLHNLLRIACLQQELGNRPGELAAWNELESFMKMHREISQILIHTFSQAKVDLTHYIAERKKSL